MMIVLIGFSGAGKSTVSKILSEKLGTSAVEMDDEILLLSGRSSITEIFDRDGEPRFRELESLVAQGLSSRGSCIVSTGGGIVTRPDNRALFTKAGCKIIYLKTSFESVERRLQLDNLRPLFRDKAKAQQLYEERLRTYGEWADIVVETDDKPAQDVASEILKVL